MVDVNQALANPKLKKWLNAFNQGQDEALLGPIYEEIIMAAHFLLVATFSADPVPNERGEALFEEDTLITIASLQGADGEAFLPIFTDWAALAEWPELAAPIKTLITSFDEFTDMILADASSAGVVINPFTENFILPRHYLEGFKAQKEIRVQGVSEQVIQKQTEVLLGEPKVYPSAMVAAVAAHLPSQPQVLQAWLSYMVKEGVGSYLIVVEGEGDQAMISQGIAKAAAPFLGDTFVDIMRYDPDASVCHTVAANPPFYQKS